ncbi:MAG: NTP transferase domain-containing protein [Verrucomicrobiales bacterium]|nr:NTP transferase domain-containing protein [Verrucomicrobiales bacterium]
MGEEKAAVRYHGKMQSEHCFQLLGGFCLEMFVSIRREQAGEAAFGSLPQIHDRHEQPCPLNGILSAMEAHPRAAWLVLGCDLPFVDERVIGLLVQRRDPSKNATVFRRKDDDLPEPMCAIYEPSSAPILQKHMIDGYRSPRQAILGADVLLIDPPGPDALINVNSPQERIDAESFIRNNP